VVLPFVPVPLKSLGEITRRPLFTQGRVPPAKPDINRKLANKLSPLKLKLEGVAITPESKVAIVTDVKTKELLRLSPGMSHGNWKVAGLSEESVTIQQGPRTVTLSLEIEEGSKAKAGRPKVPFKLPVRPSRRN
jgi:hypothetical protein